jgi:hypothetical protein
MALLVWMLVCSAQDSFFLGRAAQKRVLTFFAKQHSSARRRTPTRPGKSMSRMAHRSLDFSRWGAGLGKIPDDGWLIRPSII